MDVLDRNLKIFSTRFSDLYDKLIKDVDFTDISVVISTDKGIYYQWNQDGGKMPISNPRDPIKKTREAVSNMEHRLCCGLAPVVIIGLYPGYELEIIYRHFESRFANHNEPFRHIYVVIDSLPCLAGWLKAADRTDILEREEVLFYEVNEIGKITELCASDYNRSHLFIPVSTLPPNEINRVMEPLADFYLKRQKEETEWKNENSAYYDSIDDPTFARIISGQADRKPRLLMPVHTSSTVVQYSARDTCRIFEKMGWKTKILKMQYDLSSWRMAKEIHDFRPDLFIFINHLRTEGESFDVYPDNMMYITWIQDTIPVVNFRQNAEKWKDYVEGKKLCRDLIVGYVNQLPRFGYPEKRLKLLNMIVDSDIFKPLALGKEEEELFSCDICFASNRSEKSDWLVKNKLFPRLGKYGFNLDCLMSLHNELWREYRNGKTFTNTEAVKEFCELNSDFSKVFDNLNNSEKDDVVISVFWQLNDLIYRHIVLEWLDEAASIKLNLYGQGWEYHPVFKKYAKGVLEHGSELNKAYNATRICLHLNCQEGDHQRQREILASGALLLTRKSKVSNKDKVFRENTFRKIVLKTISDKLSFNLSREEQSIFNDFLFEAAISSMRKNPEINDKELRRECDWRLRGEITSNPDIMTSNENIMKFFQKEDLLSLIKDIEPKKKTSPDKSLLRLSDYGIAMSILNWILEACSFECFIGGLLDADEVKPTFSLARECCKLNYSPERLYSCYSEIFLPGPRMSLFCASKFFKHGQTDKAKKTLSNISPDSLPAKSKVNCAKIMAQLGEHKKAEKLVNKAYSEDTEINSEHARIGWNLYWPFRDTEKILPYMEKDYEAGRLLPPYMQNYATACFKAGNLQKAKELIEENYRRNPNLRDGYSHIAEALFRAEQNYKKTLELMQRDYDSSKMSQEFLLKFILMHAFCEDWATAGNILKEAYGKYKNLKDGYSTLGWGYYYQRWNFKKILPFFLKDIEQGRMSDSFKLNYIKVLAATGNLEEARKEAKKIHKSSKDFKDAWASIGWGLLFSGKPEDGLDFFKEDEMQGNLSENGWKHYALNLLCLGELKKVKDILIENPLISAGKLAIERNRFEILGNAAPVSLNKMTKLIELDFERGKVSVETYLSLIFKFATGALEEKMEATLDKAAHRFPEKKDWFFYCASRQLLIAGYPKATICDCMAKYQRCNTLICCDFFFLSVIHAFLGNAPASQTCVDEAYECNPYLFFQMPNLTIWLASLALLANKENLYRKSLDYMETTHPADLAFFQTMLIRCEESKKLNLNIPDFIFPSSKTSHGIAIYD